MIDKCQYGNTTKKILNPKKNNYNKFVSVAPFEKAKEGKNIELAEQ